MAWEYLQTSEWDKRLEIIAKFLKGKTAGKSIFDIDCGTARLLDFIDHDFASYYGNDINPAYIAEANGRDVPNTVFETLDDKYLMDVDLNPIDILLAIGMGAGEYVINKYESKTLTDIFKRIVDEYKPGIVVAETIKAYWDKHFANLLNPFMEKRGYKNLIQEVSLEKTFTGERVIAFYVQ